MAWMESASAQAGTGRMALSNPGGVRSPGGPTVAGLRVGVIFRYLGFGVLFVASLMFYVWSRVDVRKTSTDLGEQIAMLQALEVEQERLSLELATRRDVSRLEHGSAALGLVDDVPVVELEVQ